MVDARIPLTFLLIAGAALAQQSTTISVYPIQTANAQPVGMTAGPDGALWFTEAAANKIGRITTAGVMTEYAIPTAPCSIITPYAITAGPDGALWFAENGCNNVGRISTSGNISQFPLFSSASSGITAGPDGALWVAVDPDVVRVTTAGATTQYRLPGGDPYVFGIALGPDGALWYTGDGRNVIGRITTSGAITEYPIPTSNASPRGITAGPDGALWFTEWAAGKIGRVSTAGIVTEFVLPNYLTSPSGITTGPDGALWFTAGEVGRITTTGTISGFPIPTGVGSVGSITTGPDGGLWFPAGNGIGHLSFVSSTALAIASITPSSTTAGGGPFTLSVNGSGFVVGSTVQWNGSPLTTTFGSTTLLTANVPSNLIAFAGTANVNVLNPGGANSNSVVLTINQGAQQLFPLTLTGTVSSISDAASGAGSTMSPAHIGDSATYTVNVANQNACTTALNTYFCNGPIDGTNLIIQTSTGPKQFSNIGYGVQVTTFAGSGPSSEQVRFESVSANYNQFVGNSPPFGAFDVELDALKYNPPFDLQPGNGTGFPTVLNLSHADSISIELSVYDPNGQNHRAYDLEITVSAGTAPPVISGLSPNSATVGSPGFTLTVSGSGFVNGSTVQWNGSALGTTYVSGSQLNASVLASQIANLGNATVTITNPGGAVSNSLAFTINVATLSITTGSPLPVGTVGVPYSQALAATGGVTPYKNWTVTVGNPPPGISLTTLGGVLTGLLTGTPTTPGTFTFIVQVTDNSNTTASKQFSLTINGGALSISANGIVNAASYAGGSVSPGELVVIFGSGLGPTTLAGLQLDSRGYVPTSLAGTQVLFDGVAAPMIYTLAGQVSVVVPYEVSAKSTTQIQVVYQGKNSNVVSMPVSAVKPGIFTINASGSGPGAIVNQDGTVNSASNPASVGTYVFVYATGEGQTNPAGVDGKPGDSPAPVPVAQPVTATVGGIPVQVVQYAGGVPGLVAGVLQANVQIPQGVPTGSSVPIVVNIGGQNTQANVTLAIK